MVNATSNHCNTIQDTGCAAAVSAVVPALQKWVSDLSSFRTPSRYVVVDGQIRHHLNEVITELNAAVVFQKAKNQNGFSFAMDAAFYERAWIDPTTFAIEGSYPRVAYSHQDAVSLVRQALDACFTGNPGPGDLGCSQLSQQACTGAARYTCENHVQSAETRMQTLLIALVQNPAPSALTSKEAQLQPDMAQADTALLAITDALQSGDSAKANANQSSYALAISAADADVSALGNG
jgi:hypothetical protein